jgi:hypothetical protein
VKVLKTGGWFHVKKIYNVSKGENETNQYRPNWAKLGRNEDHPSAEKRLGGGVTSGLGRPKAGPNSYYLSPSISNQPTIRKIPFSERRRMDELDQAGLTGQPISPNANSNEYVETDRIEPHPLPANWQPSGEAIRRMMRQHNLSRDQVEEEVGYFVELHRNYHDEPVKRSNWDSVWGVGRRCPRFSKQDRLLIPNCRRLGRVSSRFSQIATRSILGAKSLSAW